MGLVEVHKKETFFAAEALQPGQGWGQGFAARALQAAEPTAGFQLDVVVVEVEGSGDAGFAVEHVGGDGAAGLVAEILQLFGQVGEFAAGDFVGVEFVADVVAHPVRRRQKAGEQSAVGGQGERGDRKGVFVEQAVPHQGIDGGSFDLGITVSGQTVGAQGVDRNQHDGGIVRQPQVASRLFAAGGERHEQSDQGNGESKLG